MEWKSSDQKLASREKRATFNVFHEVTEFSNQAHYFSDDWHRFLGTFYVFT